MAVVEPAKLPRKSIDNDMPVLDVLKSEGYQSSHNVADVANDTTSSFEEQKVEMMKKFYMGSSLVSASLHPNVTKKTSQTSQHLERQRIKRNPQKCVPDPVMRCVRNRIPECLANVGCKGSGSCRGTCREVRVPVTVLNFKGVHNGQSIWQPGVIIVSADCACA